MLVNTLVYSVNILGFGMCLRIETWLVKTLIRLNIVDLYEAFLKAPN